MVTANLAHAAANRHGLGEFEEPIGVLQALDSMSKRFYGIRPKIDQHGALSGNRNRYSNIRHQGKALDFVIYGIANDNVSSIRWGLKAVCYGFKHQRANGGFSFPVKAASAADQLIATTHFICTAAVVYQLIQRTTLRYRLLKPLAEVRACLRQAIIWLYKHHQYHFKCDKHDSNRLMRDALMYCVCAEIFGSRQLDKTGKTFLKVALLKQRKDGVFPVRGGHDSSCQATTTLLLQYFIVFVQRPPYANAILESLAFGMEWLKTRVLRSGEISSMGNTRTGRAISRRTRKQREISYIDTIRTLLLYSHITGDTESRLLARRIFQYLLHCV